MRQGVERFGKASLGLARCTQTDQSSYEDIFAAASKVLARYRAALGVRESVPPELKRLAAGVPTSRSSKSVSKDSRGNSR